MRPFRADKTPPPRNREKSVFPPGPLDIEIGAGTGQYAEARALAHPERCVVAIERTKTRFSKFERRLKARGCPKNLLAVCDQAVHWIAWHVQPETVENYFILYPNPYPKRSQHNKHWAAMPFMGFLIETLKPGGEITLATNIRPYANEALAHFEKTWGLKTRAAGELDFGKTPPRTLFEKKFFALNQACFEVRVVKP